MRVVRHQGLDACVFGDKRPAPLPPVKGEPNVPPPEAMPDLPPAPDPVPGDAGAGAAVATGDPLNQVLDAADESFSQPAPGSSEAPEPFDGDAHAPSFPLGPESGATDQSAGPTDLRPRSESGPDPGPGAEDPPQ